MDKKIIPCVTRTNRKKIFGMILGEESFSFHWISEFVQNKPTYSHPTFSPDLYEKAVSGLMKSNQMLHFAYADFEEERRKYDNAKKIYDRLLSQQNIDPSLVMNHIFINFLNIIFFFSDLHSINEIY